MASSPRAIVSRDRAGPAPARRFPLRDRPRGRRSPGLRAAVGACADSRAKLDATMQFAVLPVHRLLPRLLRQRRPVCRQPVRWSRLPSLRRLSRRRLPLRPLVLAVVPTAVLLVATCGHSTERRLRLPRLLRRQPGLAIPATSKSVGNAGPIQAAVPRARPRGAGAMTGPRVAMAAWRQANSYLRPKSARRSSAVSLARHSAHPAEAAVRERPAVAGPGGQWRFWFKQLKRGSAGGGGSAAGTSSGGGASAHKRLEQLKRGFRHRPVRRPQERRLAEGRLLAARPRRPAPPATVPLLRQAQVLHRQPAPARPVATAMAMALATAETGMAGGHQKMAMGEAIAAEMVMAMAMVTGTAMALETTTTSRLLKKSLAAGSGA